MRERTIEDEIDETTGTARGIVPALLGQVGELVEKLDHRSWGFETTASEEMEAEKQLRRVLVILRAIDDLTMPEEEEFAASPDGVAMSISHDIDLAVRTADVSGLAKLQRRKHEMAGEHMASLAGCRLKPKRRGA